MTVGELKAILGNFNDSAEVRIVDQFSEETGTYYHNAAEDVTRGKDDAGEYVVLSSSEE